MLRINNRENNFCHLRKDDDWILTYTGRHFRPLDPCPDDICIEDIAHALGHGCRYTGQCCFFYSIGEHSFLVAKKLLEDGYGPLCALKGLVHDGSEAYLQDIARPVKIQPQFEFYRQAEARLESMIFSKFGLGKFDPIVKEYDSQILISEMNVLFKHLNFSLPNSKIKFKITGWSPKKAEKKFLKMFNKLNYMISSGINYV